MEPKKCPGYVYRCSITLGQIDMHPSEFQTFIENMASEYHGDTYHLISKNCNHFTEDLCRRLIRKRIPGWVNRLAKLGKRNFSISFILCHFMFILNLMMNYRVVLVIVFLVFLAS